ncbi:MFS transporter [Pediococcus ethanolidurans]|uniref:MFS transporter n=1 Tax=Pediococcus ethanolidurans TaxID=319653 RepID=UPI002954A73D|nr:MFS transporter [Pediococcus ethanolidurans]MDV7718921.1 MFS transporter [Pediococcus ethanolidurans]
MQSKFSKYEFTVLSIVLVSYFMTVLDVSVVITALPKIQTDLHLSTANLTWVQNAYTIIFGGLLLLGGRLGDIAGRKRIFNLGLIIFGLGSLLVGLANNTIWLIIARGFQGAGAAALAPFILALLMDSIPIGEKRIRAVADYGAVAGIGASLGLVIGGLFASLLSWRYAFFVNVPIAIGMFIWSTKVVRSSKSQKGSFDGLGSVLSLIGMISLVYGILLLSDRASAWYWIGLAIVLLALFVWREAKVKQPIMPLRVFKNSERTGSYLARLLFLGAMMAFWFFITQFLQEVYGFSPLMAGLGFFPMTIANFISALQVSKLTAKFGNGMTLVFGLSLTIIGMFWLSFVGNGSNYILAIALPMILIGAGQGAALSPLTTAGIAQIDAQDAGAASGIVNVAHQVGGSLGLTILVVLSTFFAGSSDLVSRTDWALRGGVIFLILALLLTFIMIVPKKG